jgi:hypothetical protein
MAGLSLAAKAELVLGMLLPVRHRSVRLAATLTVAIVALGVSGGAGQHAETGAHLTLVVAGSLAAVAGSRLMAPGATLFAARQAARWWLSSVGRLAGLAVLLAPTVGACAAVLLGPHADATAVARLSAIAWIYATAVAALVQAASPFLGASASGAGALILVWTGGLPPSVWQDLLQGLPYLQRPLVIGWNVLPTAWRAHRAWTGGTEADVAVFASWIVLSALVAAWGAGWVGIVTSQRRRDQ